MTQDTHQPQNKNVKKLTGLAIFLLFCVTLLWIINMDVPTARRWIAGVTLCIAFIVAISVNED